MKPSGLMASGVCDPFAAPIEVLRNGNVLVALVGRVLAGWSASKWTKTDKRGSEDGRETLNPCSTLLERRLRTVGNG